MTLRSMRGPSAWPACRNRAQAVIGWHLQSRRRIGGHPKGHCPQQVAPHCRSLPCCVVVSVLLACVVAMVLLPVVDGLERRGLSRALTSTVLVILLIAVMMAFDPIFLKRPVL